MVKPIDTQPDSAPVFVQPPGGPNPASEAMSPAVAGAAYESLARTAGQVSDMAEDAMKPEMADRGSQAVTRDPGTGELTVQMRTPLNELDVAYNHAAQAAFMTQSEGDRRTALQQMAIDNIDDPQAFQAAATQYVKTQAGGAGVPTGLRGDLLNTGMQDVMQFSGNLVTQKRERDTQIQLGSIKNGITSTSNDLYALAHNGGTDTPDFAAAMGKLNNQLSMLQNPLFKMGPDEIAAQRQTILSNIQGEATVGKALDMAKTAGPQAAIDFLDKGAWSDQLNLSPAQRTELVSRGRREIGEWTAVQRDAATQLKQVVENRVDDARVAAQSTGDYRSVLSDDEIYKAYADNPSRAAAIVDDLHDRANLYSTRKVVANASPADLAALQQHANPANVHGLQPGFDAFYSGFLAPHEGGYTASDGNGQPANFGVNQGANPDIDVSKLTPDQAKQVLHDRYWVASGADALPPQLAAVVGDTAVNMGVQKSKDLLAQSGGDVNKYLDLRAQAYRGIAGANPDKAGNLPVWLARNEDLRNFVTGGDLSGAQRNWTILQHVIQERNQALTKDPAAYTASQRPDISTMLQSTDPSQVQLGVRSSLQAQRDLGVNAPRILTDGQATGVIQQFNNPQDPTKRADSMNQQIDTLAQTYGDYFPQVMKELQKKGMPPEASALYAARGNPVAAVRMATAINSMSQMGKDINSGRDAFFSGAPGNSEIRKAIPGVMEDYNNSLRGVADGPQQQQATQYAVGLYARQLAYEGVTDPSKASQQAFKDVVGSRYNFVDSYRVPTGIDQSMIQRGANSIKSGLPAGSLEPYANAAPGVSVDDRRAMSAKILTGQGVWLTRSDDKGLYLAWPQASGYMPAVDAKGKPLSFSWAALQAAGQRKVVGGNNPYSAAFEAGAGGN